MSEKAKQSLEQALGELERARDEIKVRLHLLSREAKNQWDGLEARLRDLDSELRTKTEAASESSAEKVREVAKTVREFVEKNAHV
jgi:hypothetical protein